MKVRKTSLRLSVLSLAMMGVFTSMYAYADDEEAAALKNPTSTVTVEEIYVSQGSQKFGEYNGLNKQGGYINGNVNVRGGDGYRKNEQGDTTRWSIQGTDLGLSDRSASVGYSDQGNWNGTIGYDALQHNMAPGYQTPYQGSMGGNSFILPSGFGTAANTNALNAQQKSQFTTTDISTTRQNTSINAGKILENGLSTTLDFNHLEQSGAKLQGFGSMKNGTALGEAVSILPSPTNYQTDTVTAGLNWQGEKARLSGSYFGSFFRDGNNGVQFQTFAGGNQMQTMSTMPSNQLQQLNFGGGYDFSSKTKFAGNLSYGRNTQNSSSSYDPYMLLAGFQAPAFNGLVNTAHVDFKLTDQSVKNLSLAAGYKFDSRENISQSNIQRLYGINGGNLTYYPNTPLSTRKSLIELAGDYRLSTDQKLRLAYQNQYLSRFCNQYATGISNAPTSPQSQYPAGADCVTANFSRTNNIDASYKLRATEGVDVKVAYAMDIRQTTWNQNAIAAFSTANKNPGFLPGQNGGDWLGYQPFFEASRNQQAAKANVTWQAAEELSFVAGGKWAYSFYPNSTFGVKNSTVLSLNFDANYNYAENATAMMYVVQQNGQRNMTNFNSLTTGSWNNQLQENDTTFGIGMKHAGLLSGKLTLTGDATYSLGQTGYTTGLNYPTSGTATCSAPSAGTCGSPGTIRNAMASLKFGGSYEIDKHSKLGLRYIYQHLTSNDYYYNGLQMGTTPTSVMPTNQNSGSYSVNVIAASYTYSFD